VHTEVGDQDFYIDQEANWCRKVAGSPREVLAQRSQGQSAQH
jgi:hypothetical protein